MGLVTAIFCFIIGIPMSLGGLGLVGWGAQDFHEVGKFEGHIDVWINNTIAKNAQLCDRIFSETGRYLDEFSMRNTDYQNTREGCINERTDRAYSSILYNTERYREQGFPKLFFGGLLMLFAFLLMWGGFLLMWGGNRTRRPKEVRIKYDKGS